MTLAFGLIVSARWNGAQENGRRCISRWSQ